jgi:hypothetical protein
MRFKNRVVAKTANYQISAAVDPLGTIFTNHGATGAVTFTLPQPNQALIGGWYRFIGVADQNITVAAPTNDTLIGLNDAAADSIAFSTAGQKIGAAILATCLPIGIGFQWHVQNDSVGHTATLAT